MVVKDSVHDILSSRPSSARRAVAARRGLTEDGLVAGKRRAPIAWTILGGLAAIVGSSVAVAQESELGGKIRSGGQVVVAERETVDGDLYASGGQVRIDGTVDGDLIAMGGQVQIAGEVTGDALIASGSVDISGEVSGDARLGTGQATVSGSVGEDQVVGSGQVTITSSGQVGEDFIFGAGQTTLDGRVEGDVLGSTGRYRKQGTIGGTEDVTVGRDREPTASERLLDALQRFVAILAIGALLLWLLPRVIDGTAGTLRRRPWASFGVGILGMVGFVVLCVAILFVGVLIAVGLGFIQLDDLVGITIFGTATAITIAAFVFFIAVAFAAQAIMGLFLGRVGTGADPGRRWMALVLGVLLVAILISLPVVGGWLGLVIALFGLGALILEFWPRRRTPPRPV
jgi:cytoskeletal protein CcmA (bactofilin family)